MHRSHMWAMKCTVVEGYRLILNLENVCQNLGTLVFLLFASIRKAATAINQTRVFGLSSTTP